MDERRNSQLFHDTLVLLNKQRLNETKMAGTDCYKGSSTSLRVKRVGQVVKTAISHDGANWIDTGSIRTGLGERALVGVHAYNVYTSEFVVESDSLSIVSP